MCTHAHRYTTCAYSHLSRTHADTHARTTALVQTRTTYIYAGQSTRQLMGRADGPPRGRWRPSARAHGRQLAGGGVVDVRCQRHNNLTRPDREDSMQWRTKQDQWRSIEMPSTRLTNDAASKQIRNEQSADTPCSNGARLCTKPQATSSLRLAYLVHRPGGHRLALAHGVLV